ncbi:initiation-specific alpha- -mannosyltransferase [Ophiostoma piceae UAMH 11346]|uniref:Initiation-specific alpha--mannosyltransferase n=1 Tax=Ophiostoma piceae (strain UAMH 11346) TaxID=1262450 RepID=S3CJZ4_OPHP1|nr:initiation-specific alpha- -mannosyltransferase [Ophiostoma piceae UAMH 11346]
MTDFTSNDTILARLHMAPSWHARTSTSTSDTLGDINTLSYNDKFAARPTAPSWTRFYPARLLHGARLKRLLLLAMSAMMLTIFYLRTNTAPLVGSVATDAAAGTPAKAATGKSEQAAETAKTADPTANTDIHVINGGIQKLSWTAVTDSPQIEVDGTVVKAKGTLDAAEATDKATPDMVATQVCVSFPDMVGVDPHRASLLAHIPAKIWQIYLDFSDKSLSHAYLMSWLSKSPSYTYSVLDAAGALGVVGKLVSMAELGSYRVPVYPLVRVAKADTAKETAGEKEAEEGTEEETEKEKEDEDVAPTPPPTPVQMSSLQWARDAVLQYAHMPRRVLRADFMRYLVLALEGGVYSDIDTHLIRSIHNWVPAEHRDSVKLIVGLEADRSPPISGTTYEVQFCQWTLASAADHPTMWTMLERILAKARALDGGLPFPGSGEKRNYKKLTDTDVLEITGPAAWTEVVYEHLNAVAGDGVGADRITWETLTGMREPRLFGDTLVLPIDGFATGVPHSGASMSNGKETLVRHQFQGKWRDDQG